MSVIYVTGNKNKALYFSKLIGFEVEHASVDVKEIQSLDQEYVVSEKAKEAYKQLKKPVLVEDTALSIDCLGRLPGTFIKWFIEEIGLQNICRLADQDPGRKATARCIFAYYDGYDLRIFKGESHGKLADKPKGDAGFGWHPLFIPGNQEKTLGEMDEESFTREYLKIKPIEMVRELLDKKLA